MDVLNARLILCCQALSGRFVTPLTKQTAGSGMAIDCGFEPSSGLFRIPTDGRGTGTLSRRRLLSMMCLAPLCPTGKYSSFACGRAGRIRRNSATCSSNLPDLKCRLRDTGARLSSAIEPRNQLIIGKLSSSRWYRAISANFRRVCFG